MDERLRATSIVEIAKRGDMALLKSFAYDMIINAKSEERTRILEIVDEEAIHYSAQCRETALVFANAVRAKAQQKEI
jgi:hypothetical protein